jgi:uncharacterized protein YukE
MDVTGDPVAMREAAARLRMRAERLASIAGTIGNQVSTMVYAGPGADRFRTATVGQNQRMLQVSARLHDLADSVMRSAAQVEDAQAQARAQARLDAQAAEQGLA